MTLIDGDRLNDSIHSALCADLKCDTCSMRTEAGGCRVEEWIDSAPLEVGQNDTSVRFVWER